MELVSADLVFMEQSVKKSVLMDSMELIVLKHAAVCRRIHFAIHRKVARARTGFKEITVTF